MIDNCIHISALSIVCSLDCLLRDVPRFLPASGCLPVSFAKNVRSSINLPGVTAALLFNLQSSGGATYDVRRKLTTEANRWNFSLNSCDYDWSLPRVKREKRQDMEKIVTLKPRISKSTT
jgi:hypothetical protein